ncbi:MAG: hypothetical protein AB1714_17425 [Acidobacteriota bacterium]
MPHTVTISDSVYALLGREARRTKRSLNDRADHLLAEQLGLKQPDWRREFENLLTRVHDRMTAFRPSVIEAEISAAADEVKAEHRARRRSR